MVLTDLNKISLHMYQFTYIAYMNLHIFIIHLYKSNPIKISSVTTDRYNNKLEF